MGEFEKLIQIRCRNHALNDLRDNVSFIFHSLALGDVPTKADQADDLVVLIMQWNLGGK